MACSIIPSRPILLSDLPEEHYLFYQTPGWNQHKLQTCFSFAAFLSELSLVWIVWGFQFQAWQWPSIPNGSCRTWVNWLLSPVQLVTAILACSSCLRCSGSEVRRILQRVFEPSLLCWSEFRYGGSRRWSHIPALIVWERSRLVVWWSDCCHWDCDRENLVYN